MIKIRKLISIFLILIFISGVFTGCRTQDNNIFNETDDFKQAKVGVLTGSSFDLLASEYLPESEKIYYMNMPDLILNLKQDKIDGILMDKGLYTPFAWENMGLGYIEMDMPETEYAVAFPKTEASEPLKNQIDEFIQTQTENGWLKELDKKWFSSSEPDGSLDFTQLTGENGTLRVATTVESKPFDYLVDGQYCGFDADFIYKFAKEYGYSLEIDTMDFGALMPSLSAGRYDIAISSITVTEERKESVLFSDIYCRSPIIMTVPSNDLAANDITYSKLEDFNQAKIGIITGSSHDGTVKHYFPDADRVYFNSMADMILAVEQEKIDCYIEDAPYVTALIWEGINLKTFDESVSSTTNGFIFPQGENAFLRDQVNEFLDDVKADGTADKIKQKWMGETEPSDHPDYQSLKGENGTIRLAIAVDGKPLIYQYKDIYTGFEIELLTLFGQRYGYNFDIEVVPFESIIAGVSSGKYDMGAGGLNITSEREESVDFTIPYSEFDAVLVTKGEAVTGQENTSHAGSNGSSGTDINFWNEFKEDFHKTFVHENRWKMIAEGIGVTMLISICAAIAGTIFGFGLYMLSRSESRLVQNLTKGFGKVFTRIIDGTPVVVILMILFYVVFGKIKDMSGTLAAIIGFTLTFGAFVYDHMSVSVNSVDRGQTEAAYALGYTKNKTFFRMILPQAMNIFLPSYCGQAVDLIKATAVVGYIAVNDLTKMGDIIRSNTYEAFFPLIATAIIYFLLTWAISLLLGIIKRRFEPKTRSKEDILKGINFHN
ncbi:MAG: ABC transporter permease subunit [Firmicutes bacterium]|nr:ABC transporter permease subunit [Bacillota bacterium]